jgi:hypothetical protein
MYSAILTERNARLSTVYLNGGGEASIQPKVGNFFSQPDARNDKAVFKSFFNKKQNVSFSFDPSTLTCGNCSGETHSILDKTSVFVLADQCFPAVLAAASASA